MRRVLFLLGALVLVVAAMIALRPGPDGPSTAEGSRAIGPVAPKGVSRQELLETASDRGVPDEARMAALEKLGTGLSPRDLGRLERLLTDRTESEALRNEVMDVFCRQALMPAGLDLAVLKMMKDPRESRRWRNYCVQFLGDLYETSDRRDRIVRELLAVAGQRPSEGEQHDAATAMISLRQIAQTDAEVAEELAGLADRAIAAPEKNPDKAVTALQIARRAGDTDVLPRARALARSDKAAVRVRMSAIGTIGSLGAVEDVALLEALIEDEDTSIRRVAAYNLKALKRRLAPADG